MDYLEAYDALFESNPVDAMRLVAKWLNSKTDIKPFFKQLRSERPIFRTLAFTIVAGTDDVFNIMKNENVFSVRLYQEKMENALGRFMLGNDDRIENYGDKTAMLSVMDKSDMERVRRAVKAKVDSVINNDAEELDVVKSLGRSVPIHVCGEYFGFPGPDEKTMADWSMKTQSDFFKNPLKDDDISNAAIKAGEEIYDYLKKLISDRSQAVKNGYRPKKATIVDRLLHVKNQNEAIEINWLLANITGLLVGSVETVSQGMAQALNQILKHPDIYEKSLKLANKPFGDESAFKELQHICLEALRLDPINFVVPRTVESDVVIAKGTNFETTLKKDTLVFVGTAAAMWDKKQVENPEEFILGRKNATRLLFGLGTHECLGKYVGAAMITESVRGILRRRPKLLPDNGSQINFGKYFPESFKIALNQNITAEGQS